MLFPPPPKEIHSLIVTSDLAPHRKQAHYCQGKGSLESKGRKARKSLVL
jgi:hypothetical protein